jgi:uncharacterized membrane protein
MKTHSFFVFISIVLISCNPKENDHSDSNKSVVIIKNDTLHIIKEFTGLLTKGKEEKTFIDCQHPELIHLVENNDSLDSFIKKILPNAYDGESIFLKMEAGIKPSSNNKYADLLTIKKILKAEQKNYTNTCIPYDFWCKGNEPFWQLQISEKENLIDFYDPMQQQTTHFIYQKPEIKNGTTQYVSKDGNSQNNIIVKIKNEKCSDGMSEKEYSYSAEVTLNGKKLNGCAVKHAEQ